MLREALAYCDEPKGKMQVATLFAQSLLNKEKFEQAAEVFAQSSKPFEQVYLILQPHPKALIQYLEKISKKLVGEKKQKVLVLMLELKLCELDSLGEVSEERMELRHEIIKFLTENKKVIGDQIMDTLL